jgi:hypothetical protein
MAKLSAVEKALRELQRLMRGAAKPPAPHSGGFHVRHVPPVLGQEEDSTLPYGDDVASALRTAEVKLLADQSFEHLGEQVRDAVWLFACHAYYMQQGDLVGGFAAEHSRAIETRNCYFTVEHLHAPAVVAFAGVELLPLDHADVPDDVMFVTQAPVASVAVVAATGTDYNRLAERARAKVEHALRLLRIALRAHMSINDKQLRFRLGTSYAVAGEITGWISPARTAYDLELSAETVQLAAAQEVAALSSEPRHRLERQAILATKWMEKARFDTDPLDSLLDLFSALEAVLGDKSEGLKAAPLAFRVALLGSVTGQGFTDPGRTFWLYDQVRSHALHGEEPPAVDDDTVSRFSETVRRTLDLYLRFASENNLTRRSQVNRALMDSPRRPELTAWLREHSGPAWTAYLNELEGPWEPARQPTAASE